MSRISVIFVLVCAAAALFAAEGAAQDTSAMPSYDSKDRRDPFIPLITQNTRVAAGLENVQTIDDILLEGIVWDAAGGSIAVLNGVIVKVGDAIGVVKVESIEEKEVELYINNIKHKIALSEEGE
jgi:hypothetical protein